MHDYMSYLEENYDACLNIAQTNGACGYEAESRYWFGMADGIQFVVKTMTEKENGIKDTTLQKEVSFTNK